MQQSRETRLAAMSAAAGRLDSALSSFKRLQPLLEESRKRMAVIDLSKNENPLGPTPLAKDVICGYLGRIGCYPDAEEGLRADLAQLHGVKASQVVIGNGSAEVIELITRSAVRPGGQAIVPDCTYGVYRGFAERAGATVVSVPAPDWWTYPSIIARTVNRETQVMFIANPNNPTGTWLNAYQLRNLLSQIPEGVVVVVDEAYQEYVKEADYPDTLAWLSSFPNLVITRTFSKAYGLAGLRIGYSISSEAIASRVKTYRLRFPVSVLGLVAARAAVRDQEHIRASVAVNNAGRAQLVSFLRKADLRFFDPVANFVAVDVGRPAHEVARKLAADGILVCPLGEHNLPSHIRIAVGLEEQNERLIAALQKLL